MVRLHVKRGNESQFLFDTDINRSVSELTREICFIFNGRLKVFRVSDEIEMLADHGIMYPPEIAGLTDEQVEELKLVDTWAEKCVPSGGFTFNKDPIGRRNGQQPNTKMQEILKKAVEDAKQMIHKNLVEQNTPITLKTVEEALRLLKGAVTIVYPMQLPPHDIIRMEFSNTEDLSGTQASKEVIEPSKAQLWFAGHHMLPEKVLSDYTGKNDKCKIIVKIAKFGEGAPGREATMTEEMRKRWMVESYRRQEELKNPVKEQLKSDDEEVEGEDEQPSAADALNIDS